MNINDYTTGELLGRAEINVESYKLNAQWPQGTIEAGDILGEDEMDRFGINAETIVFCD